MTSPDLIENLIEAIYKRDINVVDKILMENPEFLKDHKFLVLRNALLLGSNEDMIELLIKFGIDVNYENPLKVALGKGSVKCIELLLKNGAKLEGSGWEWESPVEIVFSRTDKYGHRKEILQLLIKYGLDPSYRNKYNQNLLNMFLEDIRENSSDALEVSELLLDCGVSVNEPNKNRIFPLHRAIGSQNVELVSFFISRGADITESMPLGEAAHYNNAEIVDLLLSNGADISAKNSLGWTALHHACYFHNDRVISLLIRRGADLSAQDGRGETPFLKLRPGGDYYDECLLIIVKELSRLSFENHIVSEKDMALVQSNPKAREHFELCTNEVCQMLSTDFNPPYSFYSVLKMSRCIRKLANLTKNKELVSKFEENSGKFFYFKNDLKKIWEEAIRVRDETEEVYSRLYSIFRDFFPELVIRNISENLVLKDLPLE